MLNQVLMSLSLKHFASPNYRQKRSSEELIATAPL